MSGLPPAIHSPLFGDKDSMSGDENEKDSAADAVPTLTKHAAAATAPAAPDSKGDSKTDSKAAAAAPAAAPAAAAAAPATKFTDHTTNAQFDAMTGWVESNWPMLKEMGGWLFSSWIGKIVLSMVCGGIIAGSILLAWSTYDKDLTRPNSNNYDPDPDSYGIVLTGSVTGMDLVTNTMQLTYALYWQSSNTSVNDSSAQDFTLWASYGDIPTTPLFTYDADYQAGAFLQAAKFSVTARIISPDQLDAEVAQLDNDDPNAPPNSTQRQKPRPGTVFYPFDIYVSIIQFLALDQYNNTVPFYKSTVQDAPQGYVVESDFFDDSPFYFAANSSIIDSGSHSDFIIVERADAIKAFAIVVAMVMWVITLVCVYVTVRNVRGFKLPPSYAVIPTTILFALPAVRNSLPGTPTAFGTYLDMCSLLVEILVGACFLIMNLVNMRRGNGSIADLTKVSGAVQRLGGNVMKAHDTAYGHRAAHMNAAERTALANHDAHHDLEQGHGYGAQQQHDMHDNAGDHGGDDWDHASPDHEGYDADGGDGGDYGLHHD